MTEILVRKAKRGDSDAFCRLIDLHKQSMYKVAKAYLKNEEDVADVMSETVLVCFEKLQTLQKNRYFKTWMIRILINKCKDAMHKRSLVTYTDILPEIPVYEEDYENAEWSHLLAPLDEKYRTILLLYYLEGFSVKDISQILDMKDSTVKSRLQRGRQKVAQEYHYIVKEGPA
ncbi:MAG: sigma-70 family RNA polymerase sigma factor [Lachnospiraceae bacterium]|jgi:RNA polymerase sigma factor (sigma-70 family)|nr:sigma-70 family RNA polymerase sigma factor [Lachnospiraceae bacterium]MDD3616150.1 sigma-70 family RNA polymerase sigma factor [Lachnospiraceae bacterium]